MYETVFNVGLLRRADSAPKEESDCYVEKGKATIPTELSTMIDDIVVDMPTRVIY